MKIHRPLLTTPPQLQRRDAVRLQREVLATQAWVGFGGLVLSAVVLRGWPLNLIGRRPLRLLAGNALVIGGGAATYLVLRDLANLSPQAIGAACGCVISAGLMVALVFEGWPGALLRRPGAGRVVTLVFTAAVAVGLNRALAGYADSVHWVRATANDWVTVAGRAFSAVGIILHVAIGQRWPLSPTIADEDSQQQPARARATR